MPFFSPKKKPTETSQVFVAIFGLSTSGAPPGSSSARVARHPVQSMWLPGRRAVTRRTWAACDLAVSCFNQAQPKGLGFSAIPFPGGRCLGGSPYSSINPFGGLSKSLQSALGKGFVGGICCARARTGGVGLGTWATGNRASPKHGVRVCDLGL